MAVKLIDNIEQLFGIQESIICKSNQQLEDEVNSIKQNDEIAQAAERYEFGGLTWYGKAFIVTQRYSWCNK